MIIWLNLSLNPGDEAHSDGDVILFSIAVSGVEMSERSCYWKCLVEKSKAEICIIYISSRRVPTYTQQLK